MLTKSRKQQRARQIDAERAETDDGQRQRRWWLKRRQLSQDGPDGCQDRQEQNA